MRGCVLGCVRSDGRGFQVLESVHGGFYQPSLDDIGARILCQCSDASDEAASTFAEYGPVVLGAPSHPRLPGALLPQPVPAVVNAMI